MGLKFHGGMEVVAYTWGAPRYLGMDAPDPVAQHDVALAYLRYANGFVGHMPYDYGTMNNKVYYVWEGMEDWAFVHRNCRCKGGYLTFEGSKRNHTML